MSIRRMRRLCSRERGSKVESVGWSLAVEEGNVREVEGVWCGVGAGPVALIGFWGAARARGWGGGVTCRGRKAGEGREQKVVRDSRVRTSTVEGKSASEGFQESMQRGLGGDEI